MKPPGNYNQLILDALTASFVVADVGLTLPPGQGDLVYALEVTLAKVERKTEYRATRPDQPRLEQLAEEA